MAATATLNFGFSVVETLESLGDLVSGNASGTHAVTEDTSHTLDSGSTPAITQVWSDSFTLSSGTATIDLTALSRTAQSDLNLSTGSLKIQAFILAVPSTNTGSVTITDGATNGYNLFGDASGQITIGASGQAGLAMFYLPEQLPEVANGSADTIDFSSGDADATVEIVLVAG